MKRFALRSLTVVVAALACQLSAQLPDEIPPPTVAEPTPIPLPSETSTPSPSLETSAMPGNGGSEPAFTDPEMQMLIPGLRVKNMQKALDFYSQMLGFSILHQQGSTYTALGRDSVQIGLVLVKLIPKGGTSSCYIKTSMVDEFYETVKARGLVPSEKLETKPSKMREFSVQDPDGNVLTFGQYTGG